MPPPPPPPPEALIVSVLPDSEIVTLDPSARVIAPVLPFRLVTPAVPPLIVMLPEPSIDWLLIVLMFGGRIGGFTLMLVLGQKKKGAPLRRPKENILIG